MRKVRASGEEMRSVILEGKKQGGGLRESGEGHRTGGDAFAVNYALKQKQKKRQIG